MNTTRIFHPHERKRRVLNREASSRLDDTRALQRPFAKMIFRRAFCLPVGLLRTGMNATRSIRKPLRGWQIQDGSPSLSHEPAGFIHGRFVSPANSSRIEICDSARA